MTVADVAKYQDQWIAIIIHCGGRKDQSLDILQEFYVELMKHEERDGNLDRMFVGDQPNKGYMFAALRNKTYLWIKKQKKYCQMSEGTLKRISGIPDDWEETERVEYKSQLEFDTMESVLAVMKTEEWFCWRVFTLYRDEYMSIRKLASATHISTKTIFNTIKYVKRRIREAHPGTGGCIPPRSESIRDQKVNGSHPR